MTIQLHWWYLSILLFVFPFVLRMIRPYQSSGEWFDIDFTLFAVLVLSWTAAIVFTLTKLFEGKG